MDKIVSVIDAMIQYYQGKPNRIGHFLKVYGYAKAIGTLEGLDLKTQEILEVCALTHDIGIKNSEIKYNSKAGGYQQIEGPPEARALLSDLGGMGEELIERVCWLIAHHHTYHDIQGMDYQILVEADFLVNFQEGNVTMEDLPLVRDRIFRTRTGLRYLEAHYGN